MIRVAIAAALLAAGTSLAMAQSGQPTGTYPGVAGGANGNPARPGINETTAPQTAGHMYMSARHRHKMVRHHYAQ
ncbi:MAG TPA: hypothetical protein VFN27_13875 [Xanthobacteraceae bacterium]|jgi:hypothetical protein|nr:hypothetical protein [Xanthobacteraceae bacterium]